MADPSFIRMRLEKNDLPGPLTVCDEPNLWEVQEFGHQIGMNNPHTVLYRDVMHSPLWVVLGVGSYLPKLYAVDAGNCEYLEKVEIFRLQHSKELNANHFYFKHTLHPVKITAITMYMPNVKSLKLQELGHLVKIEFRYRLIEHFYAVGHFHTKTEWKHYFDE